MATNCAYSYNSELPVKLTSSSKVYVCQIPGKGWGVRAAAKIVENEIIECAPVAIISAAQNSMLENSKCTLREYVFQWEEGSSEKLGAIAFGFISAINHSKNPNVKISRDYESKFITLRARQEIQPNEELCYDYDCPLWFEAH